MKVLGKPQNIPTGSGKYKPDKPPEKGGGRWNKTFGYYDEGTVDEAGISDALAWSIVHCTNKCNNKR